jgi:hypothetical protein
MNRLTLKSFTMKQKTISMKTLGVVALGALLTLSACKKDKTGNGDANTAGDLAASGSTSQSLYDDAFDEVVQEGENSNVNGRVSGCATVTLSPADNTTFPKTMTIDYGNGCTSVTGVVRKGKIVATLSGKINTSGTTIAIAFENYSVNNYQLQGTFSATNNSGNGNGLNFTTQTSNGKVTYPDGSYYNYSGTHTLAQTAGMGTLVIADDVFSWSGGFTTSNSAGNSLSVAITAPLVKSNTCRNIVSGVQEFVYNGIAGSLNFGDGACDKTATLTIGNSSKTVLLPR